MSPDKSTLDALRIDRADAPRRRLPMAVAVALLALMGVVAVAIGWFRRPESVVVRTLTVQATASGGESTLLNASGYVTARRKATVSSKVTGKVVEVLIEEGMHVEAGQVLARVDSSNVERSLRLAEARLQAARTALGETEANLAQAEWELHRIAQLSDVKKASQVELERAETEVQSLRARLERQTADVAVAEREVALWEQELNDTIIRAPFSGIVTTKNAQPGEMISPMSVGGFTRTGICTIVDMTSLEIEVDVSESYINRIAAGQPAEAILDSYPDWRIPAQVIAIIPTADRQKATVKVRVGFVKLDARILPDMSVKVAFQRPHTATAPRRSVQVPKAAVRPEAGRNFVWVVRDGRLERRAVTTGVVRGDEVSIIAGLADGERIVVEGPDKLVEGAAVAEAKK
ncbi:MAG: efflux RND transporter periplasmic adaptor subunit [Planctomycetota bacterium]